MKKITSLSLIVISILFFSSCKKEGVTVTKVINVELNANQSYSYQVPSAGDKDDVMQITKQADHYLVSTATEKAGFSGVVFNYTPALDFTGSDEVRINNVEGQQSGHGSHNGNCSGSRHHQDDVMVYDFKITVNGSVK